MGISSAKMIGRVCCALLLIAAIVHCEDAAALDEIDKVALPVNDPHYLDYTVQLIDEFDQGVQAGRQGNGGCQEEGGQGGQAKEGREEGTEGGEEGREEGEEGGQEGGQGGQEGGEEG